MKRFILPFTLPLFVTSQTASAKMSSWFSGEWIQQAQEAGFLPEPSQWEFLQTWVFTLLT